MTTPTAAAAQRRVAIGREWLGPALTCLGVVLLAVLPVLTNRGDVINLLFLVFLNMALSQSWNILGGFAGQINLGHAAFFGVGALVARSLWIGGTPYPVAFVAAGLAALAFAMLIGVPTFRLRGVYFAIGTLGITEVLRITTGNVLPGLSAMPPSYVSNYDLTLRYELALALAAACLVAAWLLLKSRVGLGVLAVREDEEAAQATGVGALKHKLIALALSSLFAGLAGGVFAFYHVSYYPQFPFDPTWTFDAVLPVFVGGVGTLFGPILGGLLYVVVRERLAVSLTQAHQVIFGVLFIIVVLALPGGIIDVWSRLRRRSPKGPRART